MLSDFVKSDRFSLITLAMAGVAGLLWYARPQLGWLPLLIALLPWVMRSAVGLSPFQPSPLDLPMALFIGTTAAAMWLSYNQQGAQAKYWLIIGAVLIYYALAAQPRQNFWHLAVLMTLIGVGVAFYFLLTHDWQAQPAKIQFLNRIGLHLMAIRPDLQIDDIHPNVAAGLTAIVLPFPIAIFLRGLRNNQNWSKKFPILVFAGLSGLFLLFTLLITTSRGAWLALGAALVLWIVWEGSSLLASNRHINPLLVFSVSIFSLGAIGLYIFFTYPGGPVSLINQLPGPSNVDSRSGLVRDTLQLIGDFPLIGAGLASFPGLYSQYILILPTFVLGHSHNLLLDVTLEQGPLGLFAFVCIIGGSFLFLIRYQAGKRRIRHFSLLRWALASSLLVLLLHGLIDDPLYGSRAVLFLFVLPGLAVAFSRPYSQKSLEVLARKNKYSPRFGFRIYAVGAVLMVALFFGVVILNRSVILSAWYANQGAVKMAKIELADWPTDEWDDGRNAAELDSVEVVFNDALALDPFNVTALYRLGLIAMLNRDFGEAVGYLETAYQFAPNNQGIQKTLGYSYAWVGDFDNAYARLHTITEAKQELNVYVNWWNVHGRQDLSTNAAIMEERLETIRTAPAS